MELVLNTYGVSLSKENDCFVIITADGEKQRIPVVGITSIQVSRGAQITSDAVILAIENEIEILFLTKDGIPLGRVWSPKYGSVSLIRKGQLSFTYSQKAVDWIKEIIIFKIENQQALLLTLGEGEVDNRKENIRKRSIARMEDYKSKIKTLQGEIVNDISTKLRGWEGLSAKVYFDCANTFLPENFRFQERSHPAKDIANALLNYGYGILYGKIEGILIKVGIDPYIGVMHRDDYNRPVLVYDIIERYRIWVDYIVFSLLCQQIAVTDEYYSVREDGTFWLEALGRRVIVQSLNDYLDEVITIKGTSRSREQHIFLYAQHLAQMFKNIKER